MLCSAYTRGEGERWLRLRQLPNGLIAREALHLRAAPAPDMDDAEDEVVIPRR